MSRPKIPNLRRAHISLPRDLYDRVQDVALARGLSISEYVRRFLDERLITEKATQKESVTCADGSNCTES